MSDSDLVSQCVDQIPTACLVCGRRLTLAVPDQRFASIPPCGACGGKLEVFPEDNESCAVS